MRILRAFAASGRCDIDAGDGKILATAGVDILIDRIGGWSNAVDTGHARFRPRDRVLRSALCSRQVVVAGGGRSSCRRWCCGDRSRRH